MGPNKLNFNLFKANPSLTDSSDSSDASADNAGASDTSSQPGRLDAFARRSSTADNLSGQPDLYQRLFEGNAQGSGSPTPSEYQGPPASPPSNNPYIYADAGSSGVLDQLSQNAYVKNPYYAADAGSLGIFGVAAVKSEPVVRQSDYTEADALYTLVTNWDTIGGSSGITSTDIEDIAADENAPPALYNAANYFTENPEDFAQLDIAAKGGSPNGHVSAEDLIDRSVEVLPEEYMLRLLVSNFDELRVENPSRHTVRLGTLDRINSTHPVDVQVAAKFYTTHPEEFDALDSISNGKTDDQVSIEDIRARQSQLGVVHNFQQVSSHNTFEIGGVEGLAEVYNEGAVRSFELDLHDNIDNNGKWLGGKNELGEGEWDVRHFGVDESEGSLNSYLSEINTLTADSNEPVSLFLDLKSALGSDGHDPENLDAVLHEQCGDRLFTPADFIASVPGATNLQEAIDLGGWPTEEQLEGRVFVVLTAKTLDEYYGADRPEGIETAAFIAPKPKLEDGVFVPQEGAIFYNVNASSGSDEVAALNQQIVGEGFLVRNYEVDEGNFEKIAASGATFLATDYHSELAAEL